MIDIDKLKLLKSELEKNQDIIKVYNTRDNEKDFLNQISVFKNFTKNDYNQVFDALKINLSFLSEYALNDDSTTKNVSSINSLIFDLQNDISNDDNIEFLLNDYSNKAMLICLQNMLVLYSAISFVEKNIDEFMQINNNDNIVIRYKYDNYYFRGEPNFAYKLLPSLYRNYDTKRFGNNIDIHTLFKLYQQTDLVNKYKTVFDYNYIDYPFCAYMQHSKAYSPFLDLTSTPFVAISFACKSSGDLNSYLKNDASLYSFKFHNIIQKDSFDINFFEDFDIYVIENRLRISSVIRTTLLCKCTFKSFEPIISIIKERVNDRMKYQKGSFLYINNAVIVNGILLMPSSIGTIIKYKIPSNIKSQLYYINKRTNPHYDYDHLMDPYKLFNDAPDK